MGRRATQFRVPRPITLSDSVKPLQHVNGMFGNLKDIFTSPTILIAFSIGLCITAANEAVNAMFGVWLEDSFKLQIAALAGASAVDSAVAWARTGPDRAVVTTVDVTEEEPEGLTGFGVRY